MHLQCKTVNAIMWPALLLTITYDYLCPKSYLNVFKLKNAFLLDEL